MSLIDNVREYQQKKKLSHSTKLQKKNDELRANGVEPVKKGWGQMVNTGSGGSNQANPIDIKYDLAQQQKNIAEKNSEK